jgi:hypothetical protein
MLVLDENVPAGQRRFLEARRLRVQQISVELGRVGMTDQDVIPLLHGLHSVTFFTLDVDYYRRDLCHNRYCLVYLDVASELMASTVRRFLRHPSFRTWALRRGKVIRVSPSGMHVWRVKGKRLEHVAW